MIPEWSRTGTNLCDSRPHLSRFCLQLSAGISQEGRSEQAELSSHESLARPTALVTAGVGVLTSTRARGGGGPANLESEICCCDLLAAAVGSVSPTSGPAPTQAQLFAEGLSWESTGLLPPSSAIRVDGKDEARKLEKVTVDVVVESRGDRAGAMPGVVRVTRGMVGVCGHPRDAQSKQLALKRERENHAATPPPTRTTTTTTMTTTTLPPTATTTTTTPTTPPRLSVQLQDLKESGSEHGELRRRHWGTG